MTGIRKRVTIGFLSIIVLLFFSGLVSLFELNNMSTDIDDILSSNRQGIAQTESMLDALRANDRAVIRYAILRDVTYADSCRTSLRALTSKIEQARSELSNVELYDTLLATTSRLDVTIEELRLSRGVEHSLLPDTLRVGLPIFDGNGWYESEYLPIYDEVSSEILQLLTYAQNSLSPRAERLSRNAYRAVTPVFISLVVMIVILLMFYYFIMMYAIRPIVEINKNLGDWIRFRLPFKVATECRDELAELRDKIETVTTNTKPSK